MELGRRSVITCCCGSFANTSRYTLIGFLLFRLKQNIQQQKKLEQMTVEKLRAEVNYLRARQRAGNG